MGRHDHLAGVQRSADTSQPMADGVAVGDRSREPDHASLATIDDLCDAGRFVSAHGIAESFAPLASWSDVRAICVGARLAHHLGAPGLSRRLALRAYRRDPGSARARWWVASAWLEGRGPLATWLWLRDYVPDAKEDDEGRRCHCWLRAMLATQFRDFDGAHEWLDRAEALGPPDPHTDVLRVTVLTAGDRYSEALERSRALVEKHPRARAAVRELSELLELHGDFEASCRLLRERAGDFESGALYLGLAHAELQLDQHAAALASLDRARALLPLAEESTLQTLASLRSDALYFLGDRAAAIEAARNAKSPFHERLVENLEKGLPAKTRILDVPFVRQHHLTCVPATLAALARYWGRSADHLSIADRICYDGTRAHACREWARQEGWLAREFTVTWDAAVALCDRGIPFIVDTVQATSAHAQAVVGYDVARGTLFIRDPYFPSRVEVLAEQFFAQYAAHGPRGFAIVPPERDDLFDGLELPETAHYAALERIEAALEVHDRVAAAETLAQLSADAPGARLTILGRRALATYDDNAFEQLAVAEAGLALYPKEATWLLQRLSALRSTASGAAVMAEVEQICVGDGVHPVFRELLAVELLADARQVPRAMRLLRGVARMLGDRAATIVMLAEGHWMQRDFERALELYRLAATLDTTSERAAHSFFHAALSRGRSEEALNLLERRAATNRSRSSAPDITLFRALEQIDQASRAFDSLALALSARPQDGSLLCFAARAEARYGRLARANDLLVQAESVSSRGEWLRAVAEVATNAGNGERALEAWREVVTLEPLAIDAHAALAQRLAVLRGRDAAREYLAEVAQRFPENVSLSTLFAEQLSDDDPARGIDVLEQLVALEPGHAWAHRELAIALAKTKAFDRALHHAELGATLEPSNPSGPLVLGKVADMRGDRKLARQHYERALELDADSGFAMASLTGLLDTSSEVVALLTACFERVLFESRGGDGVFAWFSSARGHFDPDELTKRAQEARRRRPDLFASWCVTAEALIGRNSAQAVGIAREAVDRFPLLPGAWLQLAHACDAAGHEADAVEALESANTINPSFLPPTFELCTVLERRGDIDGALHALDRALRHVPLDTTLLVRKATLLRGAGRRDEALAVLRTAVDADPRASTPWERLLDWGDEETAGALIATVVERRPWDVAAWLRFAEVKALRDVEGALAAVDRAVELEPHRVEAHDLRAVLAARTGRRSLALSACRPPHFGEHVPVELRGREAWIWAQFGEMERATQLMEAVIREFPDYSWGHQQLADWAEASGDTSRELAAAEALARLNPRAATAHGYLASALEKSGQTERAREEYRRALALAPTYQFAAHRLIELALEHDDYAEARAVSRAIEAVSEPYLRALLRVRIATARRNRRAAFAWLRRLGFDQSTPPDAFENALGRVNAIAPREVRSRLKRWVLEPDAPPHIGTQWARHFGVGLLHVARVRRKNAGVAASALVVHLEQIGERGSVLGLLVTMVAFWRFIRRHDLLWANAGYALCNTALWTLAIAWLRDYPSRKPKPWMLYNLVMALKARLRFERALAVGEDALRLEPDHTTARHLTFVSLEYALRNRIPEADAGLREVVLPQLEGEALHVHALAENVVSLARATDAAERAQLGRAAMNQLKLVSGFGIAPGTWQWHRVGFRIAALSGSVVASLHAIARTAPALAVWGGYAWLVVTSNTVAMLVGLFAGISLWALLPRPR